MTLCIPLTTVTSDALETINNFFLASPPSSEIVVVVDGGSDLGLLRSFYFLNRTLKVICLDDRQGPARARNLAAAAATNDTLVFCDSDVIIPTGVFEFLGSVQLGTANVPGVIPIRDSTRAARFFSDFALAPKVDGKKTMPVSACFSIKKQSFVNHGGFDESFKYPAGEDWEFFSRLQELGVRVNFDSSWRVKHRNPLSLWGVARRAYRYARRGEPRPALGTAVSFDVDYSRIHLGKAIMYFPLSLVLGVSKAFLASLAVGHDSWLSMSTRAQMALSDSLERTKTVSPLTHSSTKLRALRLVYGVPSSLAALPSSSPWSEVLPIRDSLDDLEKSRYRIHVLVWRVAFTIGVAFRTVARNLPNLLGH